MFTTEIQNPATGRQNKVMAWNVSPNTFWKSLTSGEIDAKDLSWKLLNDDQSIQVMSEELHGESSESNFALSVFENALDWSLGLAIVRYCNAMVSTHKKLPKPFTLMVNRKGNVFIKSFSGKLMQMS